MQKSRIYTMSLGQFVRWSSAQRLTQPTADADFGSFATRSISTPPRAVGGTGQSISRGGPLAGGGRLTLSLPKRAFAESTQPSQTGSSVPVKYRP